MKFNQVKAYFGRSVAPPLARYLGWIIVLVALLAMFLSIAAFRSYQKKIPKSKFIGKPSRLASAQSEYWRSTSKLRGFPRSADPDLESEETLPPEKQFWAEARAPLQSNYRFNNVPRNPATQLDPSDTKDYRWATSGPKRQGRPNRGLPGSDSWYEIPPQLNAKIYFNKTAHKSRTCKSITGRRILMNYAHNCCKNSQPLNCKSALKNGFDICVMYSQESVDPWFLQHSKQVFSASTMAGYGVWKPYLIMKLLMSLDDDDVLFYSDSGAIWQAPPDDYFCLMDERNQDVVVFSVGLPEDQYTKGDAFLLSGCLSRECTYSQQRLGGYSMYRKSMFAFNFLSTWLTFNQDLRIVSDSRSTMTRELPSFKNNRHDQTALSLASKRCGIPEWPDPSQWGADGWNKRLRNKPEFRKIAKTIINCTRDKS